MIIFYCYSSPTYRGGSIPQNLDKIKLFNGENTDKFLEEMNLTLLGELPMLSSIGNLAQNRDEDINKSLELIFEPIINNIINELK